MNLIDVELLLLLVSSGLVSFGVNWLLYSARVSALRKVGGQMTNKFLGQAFVNETIEPGESRELGDLAIRNPN